MKKISFLIWILAALLLVRLLVPCDAGAAEAVQRTLAPKTLGGENLGTQKTETISIDANKTYAIVFLSTKCPCSLSHLTELKNLTKDYPDLMMIGIHSNFDEDVAEAKTYFKVHGIEFPVLQDQANALANELGAFKTPHAFVISKGAIVYRGGVSDHQTYAPDARKYLREALEDLKQNRSVKTATARALGCAIPRS